MNRFVKKLLAKYVIYIEIIGYGFVVLFIAGLIGLSFIKAEDEYVALNGVYNIKTQILKFDQPNYILEQLADSNNIVSENTPLLELTDNETFIADRRVWENLERQIEIARAAERNQLAKKLSSIVSDLQKKTYPDLNISTIRSKMQGDFLLFNNDGNFANPGTAIGGVFDFDKSYILVTEFPPDKRMKKKLKPDQTGTATLKLSALESVNVPVVLKTLTDSTAELTVTDLTLEDKLKVARFLGRLKDDEKVSASINVLVGWKSWMRLIWR